MYDRLMNCNTCIIGLLASKSFATQAAPTTQHSPPTTQHTQHTTHQTQHTTHNTQHLTTHHPQQTTQQTNQHATHNAQHTACVHISLVVRLFVVSFWVGALWFFCRSCVLYESPAETRLTVYRRRQYGALRIGMLLRF